MFLTLNRLQRVDNPFGSCRKPVFMGSRGSGALDEIPLERLQELLVVFTNGHNRGLRRGRESWGGLGLIIDYY
jgi:hypothetical protein